MESLDRKFDQVLSLQLLDKSKAISQILQEVRKIILLLSVFFRELAFYFLTVLSYLNSI